MIVLAIINSLYSLSQARTLLLAPGERFDWLSVSRALGGGVAVLEFRLFASVTAHPAVDSTRPLVEMRADFFVLLRADTFHMTQIIGAFERTRRDNSTGEHGTDAWQTVEFA